jgi:glutamyl-tRNA(Gln) amidotransferase subunit E
LFQRGPGPTEPPTHPAAERIVVTFSFKPFEQTTAGDYAAVGLQVGLEVHRQLATASKLFCRCPAGRYSREYDAEIVRHMRPVAIELGEVDPSAIMESKTRKRIVYRIHHETVCTYEFDDTPPFAMNEEALDVAIEIASLLGSTLVDELHVARKQYLDGSIPAGFQRTALLAVGGSIPFEGRRLGIRHVAIEEDSCREVFDIGHDRCFLTDRLGTPLVEIVTEPELHSPWEAEAAAAMIRGLCRATRKVRTGYGTARQDVNVSVRGGTRVEIKGVPQIGRIPRLVYNEVRRQCALLAIRDDIAARGIRPAAMRTSTHDVTRVIARTRHEPLRSALQQPNVLVRGVVLGGFAGLLNAPTQEHTTFATELSDRVRVIACLHALPNIIHSDAAAESLSAREWKDVYARTGAGQGDAIVLVWGDDRDTAVACEEIIIRAREAAVGVPPESRQAHGDGTSGFERMLPGPERLYPDTDLPPIRIERQRAARIAAALPVAPWDREQRYVGLGLARPLARAMAESPFASAFELATADRAVNPTLAAVVLTQRMRSFARQGLRPERLSAAAACVPFRAMTAGRLQPGEVYRAMATILRCSHGERIDEADAACVVDMLASGEPAVRRVWFEEG